MRLICPNCGAQYEVPSNVIPEGGRDVQCSSCGHTWFQAHPEDTPAPAPEPAAAPARRPQPAPIARPEPEAVAPEPPAPTPEPEAPEAEPPAPPPDTGRTRRELDPSVAEVLREEAEREARQRASEVEPLESQPELGLTEPDEDEAARRSRESRERMASIRAPEPAPAPSPSRAEIAASATGAVTAGSASRRELLPDIEEINQTLRASSERRSMETPQGRAVAEEETEARRGGFANGFRLVVGLAILAIALYLLAPNIAELFPGAATALAAYVEAVDGLRLWLDGQITALLQMLDGYSSEAAPAE